LSPPRFIPVNPSQAKNIILRPIVYEPENTPKKEKNETVEDEQEANYSPFDRLRRAKYSKNN
jgi:hypothetical protein